MNITIMADRFGYQSAIEELKEEWLEELLIFLGIDIQEINELSPPQFFEYLIINNIDIIDYPSIGALCVKYNEDIVGEWAGPELTLKEDPDVFGGLYYEINMEYWSIVEEGIELSS